MKNNFARFIIAAPKGGAGKTLTTIGLLSAFQAQGKRIVPFKKGPDYIDAGWLAFAAQNPCYNLDPFFMEEDVILSSFSLHASKGELAIIEGNRGLFDGVDLKGSCSTAQLAKLLKAPVLLVLDCTKVTRTLAAFVKGCQVFDEELDLVGVILNQIVRSRHERIVRQSIEEYTDLKVVGVLPRLKNFVFPMRHLGLLPWQEHRDGEKVVKTLRDIFLQNVDLDTLYKLANSAPPLKTRELNLCPAGSNKDELVIGVFRDEAFQFYYPENLACLEAYGAQIIELDAIYLKSLPSVDALYIGGGFPETQASFLAENASLRKDIKIAIEEGLPVYAECGGLMYLGREIFWKGKHYPMVGALPMDFEVKDRPQGHGYVIGKVVSTNPFYARGTLIKGHEFHYSRPINIDEEAIDFAFRLEKGHGFGNKWDGVVYKNVLGAYTHVHALGVWEWALGVIERAQKYKMRKYPLHSSRKEVEEKQELKEFLAGSTAS